MSKVETKLEVVTIPVSDVDRAKTFYEGLGWRVDADFSKGDDWRVVQLTPPGSACSIFVGKGLTTAAPGSVQGLLLIVDDIQAARADLAAHGASPSEVFHFDGTLRVTGTKDRLPGPDPERRSYMSWISFSDPDGNGWLLQEVTTRLPGRGVSSFDVATLTDLLRETEHRHGAYEAIAPKHHWSGWYAAYIVARQQAGPPRTRPRMPRATWRVSSDDRPAREGDSCGTGPALGGLRCQRSRHGAPRLADPFAAPAWRARWVERMDSVRPAS
jgi:catechol 2,3-dioxygenase-like lactoylglutathione lyase family enzyme